jgi:hypothetical protein
VLEAGTACLEQGGDVAHHLFGLRGDVSLDEGGGCRVDRDLAGEKQEVAGLDGGRVWANRLRRIGRRDRLPHVRQPW